MRVAIIASVVVHAVVIVLAAQHEPEKPEKPIDPVAVVEPMRVELDWVGVVVLPPGAEIAALDPMTLLEPPHHNGVDGSSRATDRANEPSDGSRARSTDKRAIGAVEASDGSRARSTDKRAIATEQSTTGSRGATERIATGGVERSTENNTTDRPNPLAMRRREPVTFSLSEKFIEEMLSKPPGEIPDVPGARIDARIAEIMDRRRHPPPGYRYAEDRAELVALRVAKRQLELKVQKDGTYESDKTTYVAKVSQDGTVKLVDKPNIQRKSWYRWDFDITDAFARAVGQDPYAADKLKYLDRTRDQRVAIGNEHRKATLANTRSYATAAVERAWAAAPDLTAKKRILFELWDECAESGRADMVRGGAAARAFIVNFIQWKLVGDDAYTADELRALNAKRTSKAVFSPYE